jgi:hypothetical protein
MRGYAIMEHAFFGSGGPAGLETAVELASVFANMVNRDLTKYNFSAHSLLPPANRWFRKVHGSIPVMVDLGIPKWIVGILVGC